MVGRETASKLIAAAVQTARGGRQTFGDALAVNARDVAALAGVDLSDLDNPDAYLGAAESFRRRQIEGD
jgi:hypothetical protein